MRHVPLSTVRYDTIGVDLTGVDEALDAEQRLAEAVRAHLQRVVEEGAGRLRLVSCRVQLTGRTRLHAGLAEQVNRTVGALEVEHGVVRARVERVVCDTRPAADLDSLARGNDAPGVLAKLILALETNTLDAAQERMMTELSASMAQVRHAKPYQPLGERAVTSRDELRALAARQAYLLLDRVLGQKEAA